MDMSRRIITFSNLSLLFILSSITNLLACEGLTLDTLPNLLTPSSHIEHGIFDPLATQNILEPFRIKVTKDSGTCLFFITFSTGHSGHPAHRYLTAGSNRLNYDLKAHAKASALPLGEPSYGAVDLLNGTFTTEGRTSWTGTGYFFIAARQLLQANHYQDTITVTLYQGTTTSYIKKDSQLITVLATIPPVTHLAINSTPIIGRSAGTLDFGSLTPGQKRTIQLNVFANISYSIQFNSTHQGYLQLDHQPNSNNISLNHHIPYRFSVDNKPLILTSAQTIQLKTISSEFHTTHSLAVTILPFDHTKLSSGVYSDDIHMLIMPN
ncbi:hypothetical protein ACQZV8_08810 [Magnetococcales bacterium HHB-1]